MLLLLVTLLMQSLLRSTCFGLLGVHLQEPTITKLVCVRCVRVRVGGLVLLSDRCIPVGVFSTHRNTPTRQQNKTTDTDSHTSRTYQFCNRRLLKMDS